MTIKEREKVLKEAVREKTIGEEDVLLHRFLFGIFEKGVDFDKVIKWTKTPKEKAEEWWKNLNNNGYFDLENKKIVLGKNFFKDDIGLMLMAMSARNLIERKFE